MSTYFQGEVRRELGGKTEERREGMSGWEGVGVGGYEGEK